MDQRQHLRQEIRDTSSAIAAKIALLEERMGEVRGQARDTVSLGHHVERHPGIFLGGAFALGLVLGVIPLLRSRPARALPG